MAVQENITQRTPRLGSEVRFSDGVAAGKIRELNNEGFVVIKGKKRVRRIMLPYSSISAIGNRVVTLKDNKAELLEKQPVLGNERDLVSKKRLIKEIDRRLGLDNLEQTERIARITLYLFTLRLSQAEKKHFKKTLPFGIRSLWASVEHPGTEQSFDMRNFLVPIKKQGRLQSMEEAFIAAREVFSTIKEMIPGAYAMEISRSMPRGLQEIWESAE